MRVIRTPMILSFWASMALSYKSDGLLKAL
jgi:hypothetical protein